ncbi:hypothetical protein FRB95_004009 [Tulasnella sp. JGI-2019a]|nr:hypothetical protein FRB95_004009 [Tulasnella sp. JGI-2019a]
MHPASRQSFLFLSTLTTSSALTNLTTSLLMQIALALILTTALVMLVAGQTNTAYMDDSQVTFAFDRQPISFSDLPTVPSPEQTSFYPTFNASCGGYVTIFNPSSTISFPFEGSSITTFFQWHQAGGVANVTIDGTTTQYQTNPSNINQDCYLLADKHDGLSAGPHTIQVTGTNSGVIAVHSFVYSSTDPSIAAIETPMADLGATTQTHGASTASAQPLSSSLSLFASSLVSTSVPLPSSASNTNSTSLPTFSTASLTQISTGQSNLAIIGGIIAGVALLVILVVVGFILRRRQRNRLSQRPNLMRCGKEVLDDEKVPYDVVETAAGWYYLDPFGKADVTATATAKPPPSSSSSSPSSTELKITPFTLSNTIIPPAVLHGFDPDAKIDPFPLARYSDSGSSMTKHSSTASGSMDKIPSGSGSNGKLGAIGSSVKFEQPKIPQMEVVRKLLERGLSDAEVAVAIKVMQSDTITNDDSGKMLEPADLGGSLIPPRDIYQEKSRS